MLLFDTKTRKHSFLNATTDRNYLLTIFKKHKVDLVVMEACEPSGGISDFAQSQSLKTLVCSTNEDAWKWSNVKLKTDKDDALKLARMAAMNELKPVHMPSEEHREFRSLVKYRKTLDWRINKIKNTIRAWFVNHGIAIDRLLCSSGYSLTGLTDDRSATQYSRMRLGSWPISAEILWRNRRTSTRIGRVVVDQHSLLAVSSE